MLATMTRYIRDRLPFGHGLDIPQATAERLLRDSGAEPWHLYAIVNRKWRRHVCTATAWLNDVLPKNALIFEPGCGSGANLLWLAAQGYDNLQGCDLSPEALDMCRKLAEIQGQPLEVWQDDAIQPKRFPQGADAILSVNWLYHVPGAGLESFLATWRPALRPNGFVACDMVDKAYNSMRGNLYHSNDSKLPEERRRPSEYTFRVDAADVERTARAQGFRVLRSTRFPLGRPPRAVYLLQRVD